MLCGLSYSDARAIYLYRNCTIKPSSVSLTLADPAKVGIAWDIRLTPLVALQKQLFLSLIDQQEL